MTTIRTLAAELVAAAAFFAVGAAAGAAVVVFADISGHEHEAEIRLANSKGARSDGDCLGREDRNSRHSTKRGSVYLSARAGVLASTIWQVLARHGLNRLDRP